MSIAKYLTNTIIWRGLVYAVSFFLNVYIARIFEAELSGSFFYDLNTYAFIILIASLSIESGIGYFASNKQIEGSRLFSTALLWTGFSMILLLLVLYSFNFTGIDFKVFLRTGFPFVAGNMLIGCFSAILYAQKRFIITNMIQLVILVSLFIILQFVANGSLSSNTFFQVYLWSFLVAAVILAIVLFAGVSDSHRWKKPLPRDLKILFRYSAIAWVGNLVFFLLYRVDYWFVEYYCTPLQLGNYIQVSRLAQVFFLIPSIVASVVFPVTAMGTNNSMLEGIALISRLFFWLYAAICLIVAITGKWLFPLVFGETFILMDTPFLLLVPGVLALSILYPVAAFNAGMNRIKINILAALAALFVMLLADFFFIPRYGINAAALVSSASYLVLYFILMTDLKKHHEVNLQSFFIFRRQDIHQLKSYFHQLYKKR